MFSIKSRYILFVLYMDSYTIKRVDSHAWFFRFWSDWFSLSREVPLSNQMQTKIYLRALYCRLSRFRFFFFFLFWILSVSLACVFSIPIWPKHLQWYWDYVIVFISVWVCVCFFCVQNWATLTNHFEKSDFVCIIHLFQLKTFICIFFHSFSLSISVCVTVVLSPSLDSSFVVSASFFLSRFFSNWISTGFWMQPFSSIFARVLLRMYSCGRNALSPLFEQVKWNCVFFLAQLWCLHSIVWFPLV